MCVAPHLRVILPDPRQAPWAAAMIDGKRACVPRTAAAGATTEKGEGDEVSGNSTVAAAARTGTRPRRAGWLGFCAIAATIALLAAQTLVARRLELTFDEAYYTLWSRSLSFGYLDHPPMVAFLIRASTALFGGSEIGVRALSLLVVGAMPALIALIAWRLFGSAEKAALAALMWIAMPLVLVGAIFVTPDAPLVVFWTLGLAALVELWRTGEARWLVALGLALGLALESKFTAIFFAAGVGLALAATPSLRRWLASPALFAGLAVALAIFAPFVAWNAAARLGDLRQAVRTRAAARFCALLYRRIPCLAGRPHQSARLRRAGPRCRDHPLARARSAALARRSPARARLHDRAGGGLFPSPLDPRPRPGQLARAALSGGGDSGRRLGRRGPPRRRFRPLRADRKGGAVGCADRARVCGAGVRRDPDRRRTARAGRSAGAARGLSRAGPRSRRQGARRRRRLRPDPGLCADLAHVLLRRSGKSRSFSPSNGCAGSSSLRRRRRCSPRRASRMGEPGRRFDLILGMRFRKVEPAGLLERRGGGGAVEAYELYRVADPYAPVLDPVCPRGEVDLARQCPS